MTKAGLLDALSFPNVGAFLAVIREGETNQTDDAYRMQYGGGLFDVQAGWVHPHQALTARGLTSTAAGAYQFLGRTWDALVEQYGFEDFSPGNQHLGAVALIAGRKALDAVKGGRFREALGLCAREWASLPGSPYHQPTLTLDRALSVYQAFGGTLAEDRATEAPQPQVTQPQKVKPMGAALLAFLPQIIQMIPALGNLFSSGSEVATRNIAAATVVGDALVKATNAVNVQDAVERMQADKDVLAAATAAVHEILPQLMDVGGGIESARKFAAENENNRYGRILEVVTYAALLFLLLANAETFAAAYLKDDYSQIAAVIQADIGVGLMAFGFFLGSSLSSKRKDEARGVQ